MEEKKKELQREFFSSFHRFSKLDMTPLMEGLSMGEAQLLMVLVCKEKEKQNKVSGIANRMGVSPPAVSRMLKKLEEQNLIQREIDTEDRRNTYVRPTREGEELAEHIKSNLSDFAEKILSQMNEEDYVRVVGFLKELYDRSEEKLGEIRQNKGN